MDYIFATTSTNVCRFSSLTFPSHPKVIERSQFHGEINQFHQCFLLKIPRLVMSFAKETLFAQVWDKAQCFTLLKIAHVSLFAQNFTPIVEERSSASLFIQMCHCLRKICAIKWGGGHLVKIAHTLLFAQKQLNNFKLASNSKISIKTHFWNSKIHTKTFKQMSNK